MTSNQIIEKIRYGIPVTKSGLWAEEQVFWLREIAYQLALLNEATPKDRA